MSPWVCRTIEQRKEGFFKRVQMIPFHGCWEWDGSHNKKGYAVFWHYIKPNQRGQLAHRYSYSVHKGIVPDNMVIDHMCRNRGCVNPHHLRLVTPGINTLENSFAQSALNKAKTMCKRGHPYVDGSFYVGKRFYGSNPSYQRMCKACIKERDKLRYARNKNRIAAQAKEVT